MASISTIGAARRIALAVLTLCGVLACVGEASAYPWMIKKGYFACDGCHVDPSGGGSLTGWGRRVSDEELSMISISEGAQPWFGAFGRSSWLSPGGAVRMAALAQPSEEEKALRVFPMQLDATADLQLLGWLRAGGSIGLARVPEGSPHARAAQLTRARGEGLNLLSRTHWLAAAFGGEGQHSLRVGRLNLPFGIRLSEHVAWVREATQTDRESDQQHGVAVSLGFRRLRLELMGIAGNYQLGPDAFRERGYSAAAELLIDPRWAVGISSLYARAERDRLAPESTPSVRQAHGATLRVAITERLVGLAEVDLLLRSHREVGYTALSRLDLEPLQGFHLIATGELLDRGRSDTPGAVSALGAGRPRFGGWLSAQLFPVAHIVTQLDAISRQEEPLQLLLQLYVYL